MTRTKRDLRDFAVFIISNGRPDKVITYDTLRRSGYTGRVVIVIDDLDPKRAEYVERFGDQVVVFDKRAVAKTFDVGDNFQDLKGASVYARNATFGIARRLGLKYFAELDDDYRHFQFRFNDRLVYWPRVLKDLDGLFAALLRFFRATPVASVAIAQGGDFIGGEGSPNAQVVKLSRKCMNLFIFGVDRPMPRPGRINEDVVLYTLLGALGRLFFTTNQVTLEQVQTQTSSGGMTEMYLSYGTYVKSWYSVMFAPSAVKVAVIQSKNPRLHHRVYWRQAVPKILRESVKKVRRRARA